MLSPEREREIERIFELLGLLSEDERQEVLRRLGVERADEQVPATLVPRWWHDTNLPNL